jgi:hypothetical protein
MFEIHATTHVPWISHSKPSHAIYYMLSSSLCSRRHPYLRHIGHPPHRAPVGSAALRVAAPPEIKERRKNVSTLFEMLKYFQKMLINI